MGADLSSQVVQILMVKGSQKQGAGGERSSARVGTQADVQQEVIIIQPTGIAPKRAQLRDSLLQIHKQLIIL